MNYLNGLYLLFREFTAIKGELLPFLVRHQFRRQRENKTDQFIEEETPNQKIAANNHGKHLKTMYQEINLKGLNFAPVLSSLSTRLFI